jgi:hypothetical protein
MYLRRTGSVTCFAITTIGMIAIGQVPHAAAMHPDPPAMLADSVRTTLVLAGQAAIARTLSAVHDTAANCVSFANGNERFRVAEAELALLSDGHHNVVPRTDCPRTYAGMVVSNTPADSSLTPPADYVNPRYVELLLPIRWSTYTAIAQIRVTQGLSGTVWECYRSRTPTTRPIACRPLFEFAH